MIRIDAHQHFWQPRRGDYDWMPKGDPVLDRPYGPADLAPQLEALGIERTVLVQAAATVNETEYMLGLADAAPMVGGVPARILKRPDDASCGADDHTAAAAPVPEGVPADVPPGLS